MNLPGDIKMIVPKGRGVYLHLSVISDCDERYLVMSTYDNHTHEYTAHEWCPVTPEVDILVATMEMMQVSA